MANHMAEVAKMLGVELDEEFEIDYPHGETSIAKLTKTGLHIIHTNLNFDSNELDLVSLNWLLNDFCAIKRKPWKPKDGDIYYYVDEDGDVWSKEFYGYISKYVNYYKLGNCYRTREEAKANRDKWVAFYASDEVLEV